MFPQKIVYLQFDNTGTMNDGMRKYPVGIQTFENIIRGGFVYVDKTALVWKLETTNYN